MLMVLLASAGVIVLGCLVLNGFTWSRLQRSADGQTKALDRLAQYSATLSTLQDVELGSRGYVITGSDYHLDTFNDARERFAEEWENLAKLESSEDGEFRNLVKIREVSDELIRYAIEVVVVREREGDRAAGDAFTESRPRYAMKNVRDIYRGRMKDVETVIRKRNVTAEKDFQAGLATSMAMGLLALGIGGISLFLLKRVLKEMRRSERYALSMLKAEESRRQKDIFLAMMSHEIRTPLNAIIGFGQLAQQEEMGPKGKRYVQSILDGGQSLLLLINDILDLSKLQSGRMELKPEPTNVRDMVEFLQRLFQETCSKKGIGFQVEIQEGLPSALVLDSVRLRQVLMNLIGNAVKFTDKGRVTVKVAGSPMSREESRWNLSVAVRDTGPGIAKEDLNHIFEPFYQSSRPDSYRTEGTGLGLSIVNSFAKLMDGELRIESELGEGSEFALELKGLNVSARLASDNKLRGETVDFNSLRPSRILAVDDNATNRELIIEIFSETHHTVLTAADGEQAIHKIRDEKPDLVLMDLRMPVKDGPTAAREIKMETEYRLTPIIAVTAGSLPSEKGNLLVGTEFDGALRKPFSRREMFDALAMFLDRNESEEREEIPVETEDSGPVDEILRTELRDLLASRWPEVKSQMSVSEVIEFSEELVALAADHPSGMLTTYGQSLKEAAESFSFREMEAELGRFPELVFTICGEN